MKFFISNNNILKSELMLKILQSKIVLVIAVLFASTTLFAQVQLNFGEKEKPIMDINSSGHGVSLNGYYNFETNQTSLPEDGIHGTVAINDNGDVFGFMEKEDGSVVGAIRKNGEWIPFPESVPIDMDYILYDISENGKWVVGQTKWDVVNNATWGFIYNTETKEYKVLSSTSYLYGGAIAVNNDGIAVGWVEHLNNGMRMPAIFMPDESIIVVHEDYGAVNSINNHGVVAGGSDSFPFTYDINNGELTKFPCPINCFRSTFTGISDNGIITGYNETSCMTRFPIIYFPETKNQPISISQYLAGFGINASSLNGTASKISSDGKYVSGYTDGAAIYAMGWAVRLSDSSGCNPTFGEIPEITFYPNPAQEQINFKTATAIQSVEIYNLAGQKVASQKVVDGSVNINQLPSGTYIVKAFTENGETSSFKVVKNR